MAIGDKPLKRFFKEIADAIRLKTGSNNLIKPDDFPDLIDGIEKTAYYQLVMGTLTSIPEAYISQITVLTGGPGLFLPGPLAVCPIKELYLPNCSYVEGQALMYNSTIESINLPICTTITGMAFAGCISLQNISLPNCTLISKNAFQACSAISKIILPNCSSLGVQAFQECTNLKEIELRYSTVCNIDSSVFKNTPILKSSYLGFYGSIYVPQSLLTAYQTQYSSIADRFVGKEEFD